MRYTGTTFDDIIEYVTNTEGPWTVQDLLGTNEPPVRAIDDELDEAAYVESTLELLDTALLTTVEQHDVDIALVADSLDDALRSSLWARRLGRRTPEEAALHGAILRGRVRWLWSNSTSAQRRGFYAAGVGYRTGSLVDGQLVPLLQLLQTAELALSMRDLAGATDAITQFADIVWRIPAFSIKDRPGTWHQLLSGWISGLSLLSVSADSSSVSTCIQDAVVYKLVWAVEAVRVQALARTMPDAEVVTGSLALCLTYGLPTVQGALLAQSGLSSRAMVTSIISTLAPSFTDSDAMRVWLGDAEILATVERLWTTDGQRRLWHDFVRRWTGQSLSAWNEWVERVPPNWLGTAPPDGTEVRLVDERATASTRICDLELRTLGYLQNVPARRSSEPVLGEVGGGGAWISAHHFGPRDPSSVSRGPESR